MSHHTVDLRPVVFLSLSPPLLFGSEVMKVRVPCSHHLHGKSTLRQSGNISYFIVPHIMKNYKIGVCNYTSIIYIHFFLLQHP